MPRARKTPHASEQQQQQPPPPPPPPSHAPGDLAIRSRPLPLTRNPVMPITVDFSTAPAAAAPSAPSPPPSPDPDDLGEPAPSAEDPFGLALDPAPTTSFFASLAADYVSPVAAPLALTGRPSSQAGHKSQALARVQLAWRGELQELLAADLRPQGPAMGWSKKLLDKLAALAFLADPDEVNHLLRGAVVAREREEGGGEARVQRRDVEAVIGDLLAQGREPERPGRMDPFGLD